MGSVHMTGVTTIKLFGILIPRTRVEPRMNLRPF